MADRMRDIVRLRQAALLCRAKVASSGPRADEYVRLAAEIDGLIRVLGAETAALQARRMAAASEAAGRLAAR